MSDGTRCKPVPSAVSSTGGCASQDQGRDGASKAKGQGRDDTSGSSSHGDVSSQDQVPRAIHVQGQGSASSNEGHDV